MTTSLYLFILLRCAYCLKLALMLYYSMLYFNSFVFIYLQLYLAF